MTNRLKSIFRVSALLLAIGIFSAFTFIETDPIARLGTSNGGNISVEDFQKNKGLNAVIESDNSIKECTITQYHLVWVEKKKDPVESINRKSEFNKKSQQLVDKAVSGAIYYFDKVKAKCPGDVEERKINSLVFKIK